MSCLFFLMAFINTIIDSLKDSLVITAVGGGTEVIPYLTVYAVLPSSFLFLFAYSWGTQKFSRETLFNIIVTLFLSFYGGFALLYPFHESLHLGASADALVSTLPIGLAGMVGMVRNWLFTLFYCVSELWGDVVLSLLFWGLANETTSIEDAPLLYPLFGIGANIAQTMAGRVLRVFSGDTSANAALVDNLSYTSQLQSILILCLGLGAAILVLHTYISRTFPRNPKGYTAAKMRKAAAQVALHAEKNMAAASYSSNGGSSSNGGVHKNVKIDLEASVKGLNYCDLTTKSTMDNVDGEKGTSSNGGTGGDRAMNSSSTSTSTTSKTKEAMSMKDAWYFLKASPQIRCLAVMALAQGITTNLLDLAWKHYLHKLASTPAAYSAILGDTAMWTGIVTGTLMFASPALFDRMGWRGVASATPNLMMWGGLPFFAGCVAYTFAGTVLTAKGVSALALSVIVVTGALLQIFSRGAKFSLFKPAEEMVYIGLDDESRTKGKAAIDVVGAQSGKSAGSVLQQLLLIISGGTFGGILPVMALFYGCMLNTWTNAVDDLAEHYDPQHAHRASVLASLDEDEDEKGDEDGVMERGGEVAPLPTPA
jgi:AAA family ATP:ADP antiporter